MTNYNDGKVHGWNGGECPVHPETVVDYWLREDGLWHGKADNLEWSHCDKGFDIIAFRVVREHREPKTIWVNEYGEDNRGVAYYSKEEAKDHAKGCTRIAVKYQEMIE